MKNIDTAYNAFMDYYEGDEPMDYRQLSLALEFLIFVKKEIEDELALEHQI